MKRVICWLVGHRLNVKPLMWNLRRIIVFSPRCYECSRCGLSGERFL